MNRLLILDDDCTIYQEEVGKHNLPDLHIAVARNQAEASAHIGKSNIILGSPALVAEVINRAERLQWVQSTYAGVEQLCQPGLTRRGSAFGSLRPAAAIPAPTRTKATGWWPTMRDCFWTRQPNGARCMV